MNCPGVAADSSNFSTGSNLPDLDVLVPTGGRKPSSVRAKVDRRHSQIRAVTAQVSPHTTRGNLPECHDRAMRGGEPASIFAKNDVVGHGV
jgi:hypothetical protein